MSFSYRIQIKLPNNIGFEHNESSYYVDGNENFRSITIKSLQENKSLSESTEFVFVSDGFNNYTEAEKEGKKVLNSLIRSFVKLKKGIDYGALGPSFHITKDGLEHFQREFGVERLLEGGLGLKVYETLPKAKFLTSKVDPKVHTPINKLKEIFLEAESKYRELNKKELLSIQLFNSSFF